VSIPTHLRMFFVLNPMLPTLCPTLSRDGLSVGHVTIAPYSPCQSWRLIQMDYFCNQMDIYPRGHGIAPVRRA
jgi:hypothetical protein